MKAKKLIEVALPIKEISAESVRDKSIRHGHISTLHLWWARRPLPTCRAIVFASLVPDPLDENCPQAFKDAVQALLRPKNDSITEMEYRPYADIPYTPIYDPMEDNLRNRLMMFIGKFSPKCQTHMLKGENTSAQDVISDGSLIKWENKNNPKILKIARELIYIAYNSENNSSISFETLNNRFDLLYNAIIEAEKKLYTFENRHILSDKVCELQNVLENAIENFQNQMPIVFDPFAGGAAIPLEASRLGCRSYGNDLNPVAHIIEKGSAEYPQKYGKPIIYSNKEFIKIYGKEGLDIVTKQSDNIYTDTENRIHIANRLSFDVEFYASKLLNIVQSVIGDLYPNVEGKYPAVAYYWARTAKCSNPSCGAEVPLLKQFYLANTPKKKIYLSPKIDGNKISFELNRGKCSLTPWNNRGNLTCPCCGNVTNISEIKEQSKNKKFNERLLAVIQDGAKSKEYFLPNSKVLDTLKFNLPQVDTPQELLPIGYKQAFPLCSWGYSKWGEIFSPRQNFMLSVFLDKFKEICKLIKYSDEEYNKAVITYLAIWIDRIAIANTSFGVYHTGREELERILGRQSISMTFDYPESNPFSGKSGSASNQLEWIIKYLNSESGLCFRTKFYNSSSGEKSLFNKKSITAVITDPPYYDAIGYADCSDFFYVFLKRTLGEFYPITFSTPQTPKKEECTAIKHHHDDSLDKAKIHFETKLTEIFDAIEMQTSDIVSIMFAHQSTEAWTTLCNSILGARMNITGSWPMDTEMQGALKTEKAFLESSVTVACRPSERKGYGDYKDVKHDIEKNVVKEVEALYELGFRGADLLTACFGQAVSEFGRYKSVEKADGTEVSVSELLELARNAALDALLKGVQGDDYTKFYIGWLQINGAGESDYDDATKFTRVGVNVDINDIKANRLLIVDGKKIHLAMAEEHIGLSSVEGTRPNDFLITQAHRLILLYRKGDRGKILHFIKEIAPDSTSPLWRLMATLKELLPAGNDASDVQGILNDAEDWRQNCNKTFEYQEGLLFDNEQ